MTEPAATFPPKLAKALQKARNAAKGVEKNGKAEEGFEFVRSVDVDAEAKRLQKLAGLIVVPKNAEPQVTFGNSGTLVHAALAYEVIHVRSGESVVLNWAGEGFDEPGGKGLYKATTGGKKYFLAELLGIPFGIDPEEGTPESAASPDVEDVAEPTVIDPTRVSRVCAGINDSSLLTCDVVEMLTGVGVEVGDGTGASRVLNAVKRLSPEQADEVEAHLERRAQDDAALAPDPEPAGVA